MSQEPTITYKGTLHKLRIGNAAMMRFSRLGGDLAALESEPVEQAITLACAALDLPGDPIDHADDFPPVAQFADMIKKAIEIYGQGLPGEPVGDAPQHTLKSAMD